MHMRSWRRGGVREWAQVGGGSGNGVDNFGVGKGVSVARAATVRLRSRMRRFLEVPVTAFMQVCPLTEMHASSSEKCFVALPQ